MYVCVGGIRGCTGKDGDGTPVATVGAPTPGEGPEQFNWLHSVAVDSVGDLYAAEVSFCNCGKFQAGGPREMVSLRKWERVAIL